LKRREGVLVYMEILAALSEEPRGPTRLAQACNINYGRVQNFIAPLEAKGLIRKDSRDGQDVLAITEAGYALYRDWLAVWGRLPL
jgi:predicted transcriptional regulator